MYKRKSNFSKGLGFVSGISRQQTRMSSLNQIKYVLNKSENVYYKLVLYMKIQTSKSGDIKSKPHNLSHRKNLSINSEMRQVERTIRNMVPKRFIIEFCHLLTSYSTQKVLTPHRLSRKENTKIYKAYKKWHKLPKNDSISKSGKFRKIGRQIVVLQFMKMASI